MSKAQEKGWVNTPALLTLFVDSAILDGSPKEMSYA